MKRKNERPKKSNLTVAQNSLLPPEVMIKEIIPWLDERTMNNFRSVSHFFITDKQAREFHFLKIIEKCLDSCDDQELAKYRELPNLIQFFNAELKLIKTALLGLDDSHDPSSDGSAEYLPSDNTYSEGIEDDRSVDLSEVSDVSLSSSLPEDSLTDLFHRSCQNGYLLNLQLLLSAFKSSKTLAIAEYLNDKSSLEMTPLGTAAIHGRKKVFTLLLENDAHFIFGEIDLADDDHLIEYDIGYNFVQVLTPLHIIALRSDINWLLTILENHAFSLSQVFDEGYYNCLNHIAKNDEKSLRELLEIDSSALEDIDAANWTLLHWASCLNHQGCLELLIQYGADVNAQTHWGTTPLHLASAVGNLAGIKYLIARGATFIKIINHSSCLHLTAYHGFSDCTEYFIKEREFAIDEVNLDGETALSLALRKTDAKENGLSPKKLEAKAACAQLLIEHGAQRPHPLIGNFF